MRSLTISVFSFTGLNGPQLVEVRYAEYPEFRGQAVRGNRKKEKFSHRRAGFPASLHPSLFDQGGCIRLRTKLGGDGGAGFQV